MSVDAFEAFLDGIALELTEIARRDPFTTSQDFEAVTRQVINAAGGFGGKLADENPHAQVFPDICLGEFGLELKFSVKDTWRSVANSVFEGTRDPQVQQIYVLFGKMGGTPETKWARYEDAVMHVRTSHVPRFELEIGTDRPLFQLLGITYESFQKLPIHERMQYVRKYSKNRLKPGERLWWIEDSDEEIRSVSLNPRLYMHLEQNEKRQFRAEAALLCPQVVKPSRTKMKYEDAVSYLLTYRNVLCSQARDLFSAGSVALRANSQRGGNYMLRALEDIQDEMRAAAANLDDALFVEYWGAACEPGRRLLTWLQKADSNANGWRPSDSLFLDEQRGSRRAYKTETK